MLSCIGVALMAPCLDPRPRGDARRGRFRLGSPCSAPGAPDRTTGTSPGAGELDRPGAAAATGVCFLQGKQKYTLPLYHAMMGGSEAAQTLARETFAATAPQLHSNVVHYVQQVLAPKGT